MPMGNMFSPASQMQNPQMQNPQQAMMMGGGAMPPMPGPMAMSQLRPPIGAMPNPNSAPLPPQLAALLAMRAGQLPAMGGSGVPPIPQGAGLPPQALPQSGMAPGQTIPNIGPQQLQQLQQLIQLFRANPMAAQGGMPQGGGIPMGGAPIG